MSPLCSRYIFSIHPPHCSSLLDSRANTAPLATLFNVFINTGMTPSNVTKHQTKLVFLLDKSLTYSSWHEYNTLLTSSEDDLFFWRQKRLLNSFSSPIPSHLLCCSPADHLSFGGVSYRFLMLFVNCLINTLYVFPQYVWTVFCNSSSKGFNKERTASSSKEH